MATEILEVKQEGMTLDLLLWRRFFTEPQTRVETTLDANPSLAGKGVFLPVGTKVEVEIPPPASQAPVVRVRRLWG